jgi:hypothetical protein
VREGRHTHVDGIQTAGIEEVGMAAVCGAAMFGGQSVGPAGICVGDSSDRDIGEPGQDLCMASGDISGTYDADTGQWGHISAYATPGGSQTKQVQTHISRAEVVTS